MLCPLCLLPLFADKLDCCRNKDIAVAAASALKAYILVIAHHLEGTESFNVIVDLSAFARHLTVAFACDMHMLEILCACRKECCEFRCLFLHMPELTHTLYACALGVAADGCCVRYLTEVMRLFTVERFENDCRVVFEGVFAKLVELFAELFTGLAGVWHARYLVVECRDHDDAGRAELT